MRINLRLNWWHFFFLNLIQPLPLIMKAQNLRDVRWHISM